MTNQEDISHYMGLAKDTLLATCAKVRKNLQDLFPEIMILLLVLRKKNFTQMAKYGKHNEHTYRSAFRKGIDWCVYNTKLISTNSVRYAVSDSGDMRSLVFKYFYGCKVNVLIRHLGQ